MTAYNADPQDDELEMRAILFGALALASCTSDPNAPINQTFPIHQMDHFFEQLSSPSAVAPADYTRQPGYLPAYPQFSNAKPQ
jgi:hypothetical protein